MSKATEDALSDLHGTVAKVLTAQLTYEDEPVSFGLDGAEGSGELRYSATPATIAAAIKFLKDNSITCDIRTNTNMTNLRETLANKQKQSRLGSGKDAALRLVGNE